MPAKALLFLLFVLTLRISAIAQTIRGEVLDRDDKTTVEGVFIENIHTSQVITTDASGAFTMAASGGQLLEFKKDGYKIARVRVPQGFVPPWFRIEIKKGYAELKNSGLAKGNRYNYATDSIRYHEVYKQALNFPKMSTFDALASPFSALSHRNREMWQFQDDFEEFEREKFVDRTFNEEIITKFTGLKGDSLRHFMRRYRPTYDQLRSMNDYTFFNFVKGGVHHYRNSGNTRNPN